MNKKILGILLFAYSVALLFTGCKQNIISAAELKENLTASILEEENHDIVAEDNSTYTITSAGTYNLTGVANNFSLIIDAGADDTVELLVNGAVIMNDNYSAIYVKSAKSCNVKFTGNNTMYVTGEYEADGDKSVNAVIYSKADLVIDGTGKTIIESVYGHGIFSKDNLELNGGTYEIDCEKDGLKANDELTVNGGEYIITSGSDGIEADEKVTVNGGTISITSAEGIESTYVIINDGIINIEASDDGINASAKSDKYEPLIEFNGGDITITAGPGDTDCVDSNGKIIVNGGTINVTGQVSTFDSERGSEYNGGTIIVNGQQVDSIPETMMGGRGNKDEFKQRDDMGNREMPADMGNREMPADMGNREMPTDMGNREAPADMGDFGPRGDKPGNFGGETGGDFTGEFRGAPPQMQ